jgi:hypothetical protein
MTRRHLLCSVGSRERPGRLKLLKISWKNSKTRRHNELCARTEPSEIRSRRPASHAAHSGKPASSARAYGVQPSESLMNTGR